LPCSAIPLLPRFRLQHSRRSIRDR
jgi:hypothetical protein